MRWVTISRLLQQNFQRRTFEELTALTKNFVVGVGFNGRTFEELAPEQSCDERVGCNWRTFGE